MCLMFCRSCRSVLGDFVEGLFGLPMILHGRLAALDAARHQPNVPGERDGLFG